MSDGALIASPNKVTAALLGTMVLPSGACAFEKVSAALAVRFALAKPTQGTHLFVLPQATASTARQITAGLLIGNHAHTHGQGQLPAHEVRPLFAGDVLLITSAISECKGEIDGLSIGRHHRLKDLWEVISFSQYSTPSSARPRVLIANPGWMLKGVGDRRFGIVIIDAAHPRTYGAIADLVRVAEGCSSLRIVVIPPLGEMAARSCGYPERTSIWVWDPQAILDAERATARRSSESHRSNDRYIWVCDSDPEVSAALASVYRQLVGAVRSTSGKSYPGLSHCWSIYDRLRQLTVPLAHLEQASASTWVGSLRDRMEALKSFSGHGDAGWETTWPALIEAVTTAYQTLLKREETAKFWALAAKVATFVSSPLERLRIVVSSVTESELLLTSLSEIVDGLSGAIAGGRVEIVTASADARLIAEGDQSPTYLLGPRSSRYRHLDAFPTHRIDEFVYPHEVAVERAAQSRLYSWLESLSTNEGRVGFLSSVGLALSTSRHVRAHADKPRIAVDSAEGHAVALSTSSNVSSTLDIGSLVDGFDGDALDGESSQFREVLGATGKGDIVEVSFAQGEVRHYYAGQNVDVFFSEASVVQRCLASELQAGWQVISFVDGQYDGLFARLTEVVNSRLPARERIALDLWNTAKDDLFARYINKTVLYEKLRAQGLRSSYEAFMNWFDGIEGNLAPQQFDEFEVVAKECAAYKSVALIKATFEAVQHHRGRNRACGRQLKKFLRAVVSGTGYDEALESARQLDTALADVLAAVEVLEVQGSRVVKRVVDGKREAHIST